MASGVFISELPEMGTAAEGRAPQAVGSPSGRACGAHGPNPSVERTAKWRLGCLVFQAWVRAICQPLTSNVGLIEHMAAALVRLYLQPAFHASVNVIIVVDESGMRPAKPS